MAENLDLEGIASDTNIWFNLNEDGSLSKPINSKKNDS
mgnify:CR=1 FL=1